MTDGHTFDGTIGALTDMIDRCVATEDRAGYFPALYRVVTRTVRERAGQGVFQDAARMERFVTTFAGRYIDAYTAWRGGKPCSASWQAAFEVTTWRRPVIVQHLLLGMNAHINVDLAVTAATLDPVGGMDAVHSDFDAINGVLGELVAGCDQAVDKVSPWFGLVDKMSHSTEEAVIRFSLRRARAQAWSSAVRLSKLSGAPLDAEIDAIDQATAGVAYVVAHPGLLLSTGLAIVRTREWKTPSKVIAVLDEVTASERGPLRPV